MKNSNGLTNQQQSFADYYRSHPDEPGYKVYQKFYKPRTVKSAEAGVAQLLGNIRVQAYLRAKQEIAEQKADYEQDQWVQDALKLKRMCMTEEDVVLVVEHLDENNEVVRKELKQREFNPAGANKILETIGKFKNWLSGDKANIKVAIQNNAPMVFIPAKMDDD
ncbi:MAG: hypothetical protein HOG41_09890 [Gammaproteobacteria bacterium]|jgi:hypothetical protein|nr:hypothetical protein [Gammaproteobacteria bacterium]MBT4194009.1 hypothetical protein [Gammaproteobacteria bacterium]